MTDHLDRLISQARDEGRDQDAAFYEFAKRTPPAGDQDDEPQE